MHFFKKFLDGSFGARLFPKIPKHVFSNHEICKDIRDTSENPEIKSCEILVLGVKDTSENPGTTNADAGVGIGMKREDSKI